MEGEEGLLSAGTRDQMFLILREAVRNALTHSGMSHVRVVLRIGEGQATGVVENDGKGFDPEEDRPSDSGGLLYTQERTALVGGRLRVESVPDRERA